jgi:hypothetical protein
MTNGSEVPDVFLLEDYPIAEIVADELNQAARQIVEIYGAERGNWIIEQTLRTVGAR